MAVSSVGNKGVGKVWASEVASKAADIKAGVTLLAGVKNFQGPLPFALAGLSEKNFMATMDALSGLLQARFDAPLSREAVATTQNAVATLESSRDLMGSVAERGQQNRLPAGTNVHKWSPEFHTISRAADHLVAEANRTGVTQAYDFNATFLVAKPGMTKDRVLSDWDDARSGEAARGAMGQLAWQGRQALEANQAKVNIQAESNKAARPLKDVMAQVRDAGGNVLAAGLKLLTHPKEIREFAVHVTRNPPKELLKDKAGAPIPLPLAREYILENLQYGVGREENVGGTRDAWMDGVAAARKALG